MISNDNIPWSCVNILIVPHANWKKFDAFPKCSVTIFCKKSSLSSFMFSVIASEDAILWILRIGCKEDIAGEFGISTGVEHWSKPSSCVSPDPEK